METTVTTRKFMNVSRHQIRGTSRQAGFSLLEVLIAGAVITVGLLAVLGLFGTALAATQSSQMDEIAHARATQALESVYTARETAQLGWDAINNTNVITNNTPGLFTPGMVALSDPGNDGLEGTADDVTPPAPFILPGPDGILGTSDDITVSLKSFQRQIQITQATDPNTGALIPTLKQVVITVQYPGSNGANRTYVVQSLISQYR